MRADKDVIVATINVDVASMPHNPLDAIDADLTSDASAFEAIIDVAGAPYGDR